MVRVVGTHGDQWGSVFVRISQSVVHTGTADTVTDTLAGFISLLQHRGGLCALIVVSENALHRGLLLLLC